MCFIEEIARFQPKNGNIQMATKSSLKDNNMKLFLANSPFIAQSKKINFVWLGTPDLKEGLVEK